MQRYRPVAHPFGARLSKTFLSVPLSVPGQRRGSPPGAMGQPSFVEAHRYGAALDPRESRAGEEKDGRKLVFKTVVACGQP